MMILEQSSDVWISTIGSGCAFLFSIIAPSFLIAFGIKVLLRCGIESFSLLITNLSSDLSSGLVLIASKVSFGYFLDCADSVGKACLLLFSDLDSYTIWCLCVITGKWFLSTSLRLVRVINLGIVRDLILFDRRSTSNP